VDSSTVNSLFKKDLKFQIHLHMAFFSDDRFLGSLHKSLLNQTTLDLRKEKWTFLNREFTVPYGITFDAVGVFGLAFHLLFKSCSTYCDGNLIHQSILKQLYIKWFFFFAIYK
jgi:hypothetical protein